MSGSDDNYFTDDLVLDDKSIAVLDQQESKFRRTTNSQTQRSVAEPPPKRQKTTETSWQSQEAVARPLRRVDTEDLEDYPDVAIRQDGTYDLRDRQRRPSGPPSRSEVAPRPNVAAQPQAGPGSKPTTTAAASAPPSRGPTLYMRGRSGAGPARMVRPSSRPPSVARSARATQSPASSQEVSRTQSGPPQRVPSNSVSLGFVEQLQRQVEELRKQNEMIQASMESALEAKFAKEGEVTILRKRLEKTAQDHMAQVAKLKAAKDEADAKHVVTRKQFEAEKERLRTELTFRRHELETSIRKHIVAPSPRKEVPQLMEPLAFQRQSAGPSWLPPETPHRPRFGLISDLEKQKKPAPVETRHLPSGFQTSTPRSQTMVERKGKGVNAFNAPNPSPMIPGASPLRPMNRLPRADVFGSQVDDGGPADDFIPFVDDGIGDVHMMDEEVPVTAPPSQTDVPVLALSSWNLVLHDITLMHTPQGSTVPTLQLLVSTSPTNITQTQSYGLALMRIFNTLGGITAQPDGDFGHFARIICGALCEIAELLARNDLIHPLTALLNLLTNLAYMLPSVYALLLSQRVPEHAETPHLLVVLHEVIKYHLQKLDDTASTELHLLGKGVLSLYEALVWWIPDDHEDCFPACPDMSCLLTMLLHPHRPLWFLIESMRIFLWLSTRRNLFRSFLSYYPAGEKPGAVDPAHHPEIGVVCNLLTDFSRQGPEADELKSHIVMFFGMLSNAHPDAYTLLVESQELIPSLVLYLCCLVAPIWDENQSFFDDDFAVTRTLRIINHATLLLHHLVIGGNATLDLREYLLRAPPTTYLGLMHAFILTFGRLSYANPPYWLDEKNKARLAAIAELARALLERVIQGPELDLIWETYQDEGEDEGAMDIDDEEVEAQKIVNDDV